MKPSPLVPVLEIDLDKPRKMSLSLNAMADYKKLTGKSALMIPHGIDEIELRALLYSCLLEQGSELSLEEVGALVHFGNFEYIADKLDELVMLSFPQAEQTEEPKPPVKKVNRPTSKTSGKSAKSS